MTEPQRMTHSPHRRGRVNRKRPEGYKRNSFAAQPGGLVITRDLDESVLMISGELEIEVQVVRLSASNVRLRIMAPPGVAIVRSEIRDRGREPSSVIDPSIPQISDADRQIIAICSEQNADPPPDVQARVAVVRDAVRVAAMKREGIHV